MESHKTSQDWQVDCFGFGGVPVPAGKISRALADLCGEQARHLLDEEALVLNVDFPDRSGLILLMREEDRVWVACRERLRHDEDLRELARVYSVIARGSDATVFTDATGSLLSASRTWRRIYDFSPKELIGKNPRIINSRLQPKSYHQKMWHDLTSRSVGTWSGELVNRRKNGELVRVWQTITTVRGSDGMIQGYLGQTRDMTEYVAVREQLKRQNERLTELNRFKGEMMEIMAHDLKAPLQGVLGYAELLQESLQQKGDVRLLKQVERIDKAGRSMLDLVRNFLELQRSDSGEMTVVRRRQNLRNVLRAVVDWHGIHAGSRGVEVAMEEEGQALPAYFDPLRIEQAINNVVSNAVKYTKAGTRVVVRLISRSGEPERIEVEDEGEGIPEEEIEHIFDAYYQIQNREKHPGSVGWGLAIAKKVMELHGGGIRAENRVEGGSRFILELPYGYEVYHEMVSSVVLFDPREEWCRPLLDFLKSLDIQAFVAAELQDLHLLCQQEIPSAVFLDASCQEPLPPLRSPDSQCELSPAVLYLRREEDGRSLSIKRVAGNGVLVRKCREVLEKFGVR